MGLTNTKIPRKKICLTNNIYPVLGCKMSIGYFYISCAWFWMACSISMLMYRCAVTDRPEAGPSIPSRRGDSRIARLAFSVTPYGVPPFPWGEADRHGAMRPAMTGGGRGGESGA